MFTGIIEEIGVVQNTFKHGLVIKGEKIIEDLQLGDSVAVNGVCLTVTSFTDSFVTFDVMPETFKRTTLGKLKVNSLVNLERAMPLNGRFGGHIVSGHVDGVGKISKITRDENAIKIYVEADNNVLRYVVAQGSIALDGISLTVVNVKVNAFSVSIIPHTLQSTALQAKKIGDKVNIETDIFGKYVEKLFSEEKTIPPSRKENTLTKEKLFQYGFHGC